MRNSPLVSALLVALGVCTPACDTIQDLDRRGGESERGYFRIAPSAAVAEGGRLPVEIRDHETFGGGSGAIGLESMASEAPTVLGIASFASSGAVLLQGLRAGDSRLTFRARADGALRDDAQRVRVEPVTRLSLAQCDPHGVALRGSVLHVAYRFNPQLPERTLGLGLFPLAVEPAAALTLLPAPSDTERFAFDVPAAAPAQVSLHSTLPGDPERLALELVERSELDGLAPLPAQLTARAEHGVDLRPRSQGRVVCGQFVRLLRSRTPKVCAVYVAEGEPAGQVSTDRESAFVRLIAAGACELELQLPGLALALRYAPVAVLAAAGAGGDDRDEGSDEGDWGDWD